MVSGKARRHRDRSSEPGMTGITKIETFIASKDDFRVAPSGTLPTPWPFHQRRPTEQASNVFNAVESQCQSIVKSYDIRARRIDMHSIVQKDKEETRRDCLIVETKDQDVTSWSNAANELQVLLTKTTLAPDTFKVEIRNPDLFYADRSSILPDDDDLINCINAIEDQVLQTALTQLGKNCISIAYHSRQKRLAGSPRIPTVLVFVRPGTLAVWEVVEISLLKAIQGPDFPQITLSLEILVGKVQLGVDVNSAIQYLQLDSMKPFNGCSVGVAGRRPDSGSLGGWLKLVRKETGEVFRGFLTCYHVIATGDKEQAAKNSYFGIGLVGEHSDLNPHIEVVWPSEHDREAWKSDIQTLIARGDATNANRSTLAMLSHEDTMKPIGSVRFASGFEKQAESGARLDWAFVMSPETSLENHPPPPVYDSLKPSHIQYVPTDRDLIKSFGRMKPGDWLVRRGRTSIEHGEVNRIHRQVLWDDHPPSKEMEVLGFRDDFARPGDSGSWVVNAKLELVGMLIGMDSEGSSGNVGFVTPIHDIMDDIEKRTGCVVSLP
ncbi:hypothetical protein QTJ16_006801 [Diplocarpon rosae]|uniref:Uncharacterized protein n=1 Tax=Diplocarpon rosae TaxID=946125 RepID=A0AAD9STV3_9HELO|nr:hypothetical protein QTJ16_006801 [Diplocarpon rosae]